MPLVRGFTIWVVEVVEFPVETVFEVVTIVVEAVVMIGIGVLIRTQTSRLQEAVTTYREPFQPVQFQVNSSR